MGRSGSEATPGSTPAPRAARDSSSGEQEREENGEKVQMSSEGQGGEGGNSLPIWELKNVPDFCFCGNID